MDITVKNGDTVVATGTLEVDTSVNPVTATFQPDDGTEEDCTGVVWSTSPNGNVGFDFKVTGAANGDFPCGKNGGSYTYRFTGNQNANGDAPNGTVNFPGAGIEDDDNDTWQAGASAGEEFDDSSEEPYASSQAAG